jgi:hypothetical protein
MSDLAIFIAGSAIFSVTTGATLLYGYLTFARRADDEAAIPEPVGVDR